MKKVFVCFCLLLAMAGAAIAADPIKIGYIAALTGDASTWGQHEADAAKLAVKEINAAGGLLGRPVELVVYDIKGKPEDAVNAVRRLVHDDKVVAIGGSNMSGIQLAISPIVNSGKVPTMATAATNPAVTVNPDKGEIIPYMFRITYTDPYQGKVMADYLIKKLGFKKIAIIGDVGDAYSEGLTEFIKKRCEELGVECKFWGYRAGDVDFRAQITEMKAWGADALAMTMYYKEMALVMKQAVALGWKPAFIGGDGYSPSIFEIAGEAAEGSYWVYPLNEKDDKLQGLFANFEKEYGKKPTEYINVVFAYDVIQILADAIKRAGKAEGEAVKNALEDTKDLELVHFKYTVDKSTHNPLNKPAAVLKAKGNQLDFLEMWEPQDSF